MVSSPDGSSGLVSPGKEVIRIVANVSDTCRYCEHLKDVSRPREEYIGICEFRLHPDTCGRFELARCYEGRDPREVTSERRR